MERRKLGRTGLDVSLLTFGCGAVGGLMTKGDPADQDRAVAWARDNGINHFDTAPLYGNTASETNLGRALGTDRSGVIVSTKVRLSAADRADPETAIRDSIEGSLRRLRQDHVDLFQFHNTIGTAPDGMVFSAGEVLDAILPVFEALRGEGKTRYLGFTANGEVQALHRLVRSGRLDAAQVFYNVLVPSAGEAVPEGYPGQDYGQLLHVAAENGVGSIGVRVLAGGALSGSETRHPLGMPVVDPIGSGRDYAEDAARARALQPVVDAGHTASLPELAVRYVISNPALSTTEIGIATLEELQQAADAVNTGPLKAEALSQIDAIRAGWVRAD
ncbi:MAG: aldo/keto reductase [Paracoccaceae bacterium]|nr:aldo/keto reductase [Paracoccaceae bacterium]